MRLRNAHRIDGSLVYDLERTFVLREPEAHDVQWLRDEDLLTDAAPPDWSERSSRLPPVTDVSFDLAGACNLACVYCFEKDIVSRTGALDRDTAAAAVDFAFERAAPAKRLVLHFGSGEPLLRFRLLRQIVSAAEARAADGWFVGFDLTTNGTLVTPQIADFFADHAFNIRVSFDGPPAIQDRNRPLLRGGGSYAHVQRGLKLLLERLPERVILNSVLTGGTRLTELWEWAKTLGVRHMYVIKVGAADEADVSLREAELREYADDLAFISNEIFEHLSAGEPVIDYLAFTRIIRRLVTAKPVTRYCGAGGTYLGISTDGTVYPCFRHIGLTDYALGDVHRGVDDEARARYRSTVAADVERRPVCSSCWARYLCGGACYADSVVYGTDVLQPLTRHCAFWQAEIEEAIRLYDRLVTTHPEACLRILGENPDRIC